MICTIILYLQIKMLDAFYYWTVLQFLVLVWEVLSQDFKLPFFFLLVKFICLNKNEPKITFFPFDL